MFSPLEQFNSIKLLQLSFTWNYLIEFCFESSSFNIVIPLFLVILLFIFYFFLLNYSIGLIPNSILQFILENIIIFIFNLIKQQIGEEGYILFPFIFVLFNSILCTNLLGLVPFGIALTSHIIMIFLISLGAGLSIFILGVYLHNIQFLKIFIPECPFVLLPMLILIECFHIL